MDKKVVDKLKESVSMKEIETFAKRYPTRIFLILAIAIASISSIFDFFIGARWSIFFAAAGAIFSIAFPKYATLFQNKITSVFKQKKSVQMLINILRLVIALFLPFIIFAVMGMLTGSSFHMIMKEADIEKKSEKKEK